MLYEKALNYLWLNIVADIIEDNKDFESWLRSSRRHLLVLCFRIIASANSSYKYGDGDHNRWKRS
jgi:hypothetical protein